MQHIDEAVGKVSRVRDGQDWVARLRSDEQTRQAALEELRKTLSRSMSRSLMRRGGGEAFVEDVVQDALVKILDSLDTFAGRSRFTTWAMAIATRIGISKLRRRHFENVSLDELTSEDDLKFELIADSAPSPSNAVDRNEILAQLQQLIERTLTDKQKKVMQAALSGMPMEEIALRMNSNRNAIYKLFHDARKKLRAGFESRGVTKDDIQAALT